jgi:hypothetical protein
MLGALFALPVYVPSFLGQLAAERAENDNRQDFNVGDMLAVLPAATAGALLERLGARGILGIDDALTSGRLSEIGKAIGRATVREGATETIEETLEHLTTTLGTERQTPPLRTRSGPP